MTKWYGLIIEKAPGRKDFIGNIFKLNEEGFILVKCSLDKNGFQQEMKIESFSFEKVISFFSDMLWLNSQAEVPDAQSSTIFQQYLEKFIPREDWYKPIFITQGCIDTIVEEITANQPELQEEGKFSEWEEDEFPGWEEDEFPGWKDD